LGAKSKHCIASHQAQNQCIPPPAIGREIKASRCQPLGANLKHRAAIWHSNSALQPHWVLIISIAPPLGTSFKYCATIEHFFQALRCHQALE
jgi:hypothetical protein